MADTVTVDTRAKGGVGALFGTVRSFWTEMRAEFRKITWPDREQLRQATVAIIIFVLLIGLLIYAMDVILQGLLVSGIPALFGVR